jgi:putative peptidoglycan lipid II flippase
MLGIDPQWGVAGLTASAGIAGWVEFALLRSSLNRRIGRTGLPSSYVIKLWLSAGIGAGLGWGLKVLVGHRHPLIVAVIVLGGYGVAYFGVTSLFGIGEARRVISRGLRMFRL